MVHVKSFVFFADLCTLCVKGHRKIYKGIGATPSITSRNRFGCSHSFIGLVCQSMFYFTMDYELERYQTFVFCAHWWSRCPYAKADVVITNLSESQRASYLSLLRGNWNDCQIYSQLACLDMEGDDMCSWKKMLGSLTAGTAGHAVDGRRCSAQCAKDQAKCITKWKTTHWKGR